MLINADIGNARWRATDAKGLWLDVRQNGDRVAVTAGGETVHGYPPEIAVSLSRDGAVTWGRKINRWRQSTDEGERQFVAFWTAPAHEGHRLGMSSDGGSLIVAVQKMGPKGFNFVRGLDIEAIEALDRHLQSLVLNIRDWAP